MRKFQMRLFRLGKIIVMTKLVKTKRPGPPVLRAYCIFGVVIGPFRVQKTALAAHPPHSLHCLDSVFGTNGLWINK